MSDAVKKDCWFRDNWYYLHYLSRVFIAILVVICIGNPLTNNFNSFLDPMGIKEFVSVTVTVKEAPLSQTNNAKDASGNALKEKQSATETVREDSFAPRVWVYGLRIFGLLAALGGVLWAVVALCRE
ncbi:MAG: hypothetical protein ABL869_03815 [Candidatus Nitrotoga sp.]